MRLAFVMFTVVLLFVSPMAAQEAALQPEPITFDTAITEIGRLHLQLSAMEKYAAQLQARVTVLQAEIKSLKEK